MEMRDLAHNDHQTNIIADSTNILNEKYSLVETILGGITEDQNRLAYLVTKVDDLSKEILLDELDKSTRSEERLIILNRLCDLDMPTYGPRMEVFIRNLIEQGSMVNDPFYVGIMNTYPIISTGSKKSIDECFSNVVRVYRDQVKIALFIAVKVALVESNYSLESDPNDFITYIDSYIDSICETTKMDPMMFRASIDYMNFLVSNNMMSKLDHIIQWIDSHKEEAIYINSSTDLNTTFDVLLLINRMKHFGKLSTQLTEASWNDKELAVINATSADEIHPYEVLNATDDSIRLLFRWYNDIIESYT
jgi:hypothetical protein